jgi:hypothetical protein
MASAIQPPAAHCQSVALQCCSGTTSTGSMLAVALPLAVPLAVAVPLPVPLPAVAVTATGSGR